MEIFKFNKNSGQQISKFNSDFIMSRIIQTTQAAHIGCMHLEKDGVVGYHRAVCPQLLLIVSGVGCVRGEQDNFFEVAAGDAVFWNKDEWHETKSAEGMMAIVIGSEELVPAMSIL